MVANSHWLAEIVSRSPIVKACGGVQVIPPGIDTTLFKPQDKNLCRKHLDLPIDPFVIVTGGASLTDANKNVRWLFEQLSGLPDLAGVIVLAFGEGTVSVPSGLNVRFARGIPDKAARMRWRTNSLRSDYARFGKHDFLTAHVVAANFAIS